MASIVGKDLCITKIVPILQELLKDDNSEVRLNVAQNLGKLAAVVGEEVLSPALIVLLQNATKDQHWRVRMAVFETVGDLAVKFGKDAYTKHLEALFMSYLTNTAAAVREMGIQKAESVGKAFGSNWIAENFVPKVIKTYEEDQMGYNFRLTAIKSLAIVMKYMSKDDVTNLLVPIFIKASNDKVPNVQFICCQLLTQNRQYIDKSVFEI